MKKQSKLELSERQIKVLNHRILEVECNEISLQYQLTTYELTNKAQPLPKQPPLKWIF